MTLFVGVDPGTRTHGVVAVCEDWSVLISDPKRSTTRLLHTRFSSSRSSVRVIIEGISSYGARVGQSTFDTIHNAGRIHQHYTTLNATVDVIIRRDVKTLLGLSQRCKDKDIRAACIQHYEMLGFDNPTRSILKEVSSHGWSALALVIAYRNREAV